MPNWAGEDLVGLGREMEGKVAEILRRLGHSVAAPENRHYDLLCDGKVRVEVKVANPSGGELVWAFNSRKRFSDHCDVVVLVANFENGLVFYVLPADHLIFYTRDGKPKAGIGITVKPTKRLRETGLALERHRDRWELVSQIGNGAPSSFPMQEALL